MRRWHAGYVDLRMCCLYSVTEPPTQAAIDGGDARRALQYAIMATDLAVNEAKTYHGGDTYVVVDTVVTERHVHDGRWISMMMWVKMMI